jgi:hypothetical protein
MENPKYAFVKLPSTPPGICIAPKEADYHGSSSLPSVTVSSEGLPT